MLGCIFIIAHGGKKIAQCTVSFGLKFFRLAFNGKLPTLLRKLNCPDVIMIVVEQ
jgi:hypothetical protein